MKKFLKRLFGQDASSQGEELARKLVGRFPVSLDDKGLPKLSADRLARILERVYSEAQTLRDNQKLGYLWRVRLCHAFQWHLREMGYSKLFVDMATEGLVVYLHKQKFEAAAELGQAKNKRERKAVQPKSTK